MATGKPHLDTVRGRIALAADELPPDVGPRFRAVFGRVGVSGRERMFPLRLTVGPAPEPLPTNRTALVAVQGVRPLPYEVGGP